jgi:hypothetical protein
MGAKRDNKIKCLVCTLGSHKKREANELNNYLKKIREQKEKWYYFL